MKRLQLILGLFGLGVCLSRPAIAETEVSKLFRVESFSLSGSFHDNPRYQWQTMLGLEITAASLSTATFKEIALTGSGQVQTVGTFQPPKGESRWLRNANWLFDPELRLRWRNWPLEIALGENHLSTHLLDLTQNNPPPNFNNLFLELRLKAQPADPRARPNQFFLRGQYNVHDNAMGYQRPLAAGFYWAHALASSPQWYLAIYNEQFIEAGNVLFYAGELGVRIASAWNTPFELFTLWTNGRQGVSAFWGAVPELRSRSATLFDVGARLHYNF